jgi:hypothetical protein
MSIIVAASDIVRAFIAAINRRNRRANWIGFNRAKNKTCRAA